MTQINHLRYLAVKPLALGRAVGLGGQVIRAGALNGVYGRIVLCDGAELMDIDHKALADLLRTAFGADLPADARVEFVVCERYTPDPDVVIAVHSSEYAEGCCDGGRLELIA